MLPPTPGVSSSKYHSMSIRAWRGDRCEALLHRGVDAGCESRKPSWSTYIRESWNHVVLWRSATSAVPNESGDESWESTVGCGGMFEGG